MVDCGIIRWRPPRQITQVLITFQVISVWNSVFTWSESEQSLNISRKPLLVTWSPWHCMRNRLLGACFPISLSQSSLRVFLRNLIVFPEKVDTNHIIIYYFIHLLPQKNSFNVTRWTDNIHEQFWGHNSNAVINGNKKVEKQSALLDHA